MNFEHAALAQLYVIMQEQQWWQMSGMSICKPLEWKGWI